MPGRCRTGFHHPYSATEVINPLRASTRILTSRCTHGGEGHPEWPGTYDAGDRFLWSDLQPTDADDYDFSAIDDAIEAARRGERFHFRVMALCSKGCAKATSTAQSRSGCVRVKAPPASSPTRAQPMWCPTGTATPI